MASTSKSRSTLDTLSSAEYSALGDVSSPCLSRASTGATSLSSLTSSHVSLSLKVPGSKSNGEGCSSVFSCESPLDESNFNFPPSTSPIKHDEDSHPDANIVIPVDNPYVSSALWKYEPRPNLWAPSSKLPSTSNASDKAKPLSHVSRNLNISRKRTAPTNPKATIRGQRRHPLDRARSTLLGKICSNAMFPKQQRFITPPHHFYVEPLDTPQHLPIDLKAGCLEEHKLLYGREMQFLLMQSLDGEGGKYSNTYVAAHYPVKLDFRSFVVLRRFRKGSGTGDKDALAVRGALRQEVRAFKRLVRTPKEERKYILLSHGCVESTDSHFLVQPYMQCNLLSVLNGDTELIKRKYAMSWILQIADALATLHWNGIIHRNLRPSNIYIDHEGAIKVGDFTRSYVDGEGVNGGPLQCGLKYAYRVRGSVEYMAPEMRDQELNIPLIKKHGLGDYDETIAGLKAYGPEVDVWAFGCLVVDILRDSKHYEPMFFFEDHYTKWVDGTSGDQHQFLTTWLKFPSQVESEFIRDLLQVEPAHRLTLEEIPGHQLFIGKSCQSLIKLRTAKAAPRNFVLKHNVTSPNIQKEAIITTNSVPPTCETPSIHSLEHYTYLNPRVRRY